MDTLRYCQPSVDPDARDFTDLLADDALIR